MFSLQTQRCPFPVTCPPPALSHLIKQQDSRGHKNWQRENFSKISGFLTLNGLAWVPVFKMLLEFVSSSGRTMILKHNDNHKRSSVSIYSERSKDAAGLWVYSAMYHYRRVSRPVDGWAVLSSPFITLVNSEGIFFFFYLVKGPSAMNQWSEDDSWFVNLDSIKWLCFGGLCR